MTHPWTAEREVPPELALSLVREQFPELGAREVRPFGSGWDNTACVWAGPSVRMQDPSVAALDRAPEGFVRRLPQDDNLRVWVSNTL